MDKYDYNPFLMDYNRSKSIAIDYVDKKCMSVIFHF